MKVSVTGVGAADNTSAEAHAIYDSTGSGMLPIQAEVTGTATFKVNGKAALDAPWVEIIAAGSAGFLQSIAWVPYVQLEITSGAGTVDLWVAEK